MKQERAKSPKSRPQLRALERIHTTEKRRMKPRAERRENHTVRPRADTDIKSRCLARVPREVTEEHAFHFCLSI